MVTPCDSSCLLEKEKLTIKTKYRCHIVSRSLVVSHDKLHLVQSDNIVVYIIVARSTSVASYADYNRLYHILCSLSQHIILCRADYNSRPQCLGGISCIADYNSRPQYLGGILRRATIVARSTVASCSERLQSLVARQHLVHSDYSRPYYFSDIL